MKKLSLAQSLKVLVFGFGLVCLMGVPGVALGEGEGGPVLPTVGAVNSVVSNTPTDDGSTREIEEPTEELPGFPNGGRASAFY